MENDKNIPVVILCGGTGTRLRGEMEYKPKPMVEIGDKPILWHIMKLYNYEAMSNDFTINLGKGNHLAYQSNHTEQDFNVTNVDTGLKTMRAVGLNALNNLLIRKRSW